MEKTMYDVWEEDTNKVAELLRKMMSYSVEFEIPAINHAGITPTEFHFYIMIDEVERLKSIPCEQPQSESVSDHAAINDRIREIEAEREVKEQKMRHIQDMEMRSFEHKNRMELETLFYPKAFDKKALDDLESILATPTDFGKLPFKKEGFLEDQKRKAIFWCHQQAALLGGNGITKETAFGNVYSFENTIAHLFATFFPNLAND